MTNKPKMVDIRIRKVSALGPPLHAPALDLGFRDDELVIVRTTLERVDGSPMEYLQKRMRVMKRKKSK